ncbi:MAG: hypothetical protein M1818_003649 [Claussenomyces sp. TS43310]|nr:MAG: hypothetical protein M1818_003649 [Claussenomyces sp. TS43310]
MSLNPALGRPKSLRAPAANALKPPAPQPLPANGPSNLKLFLANLKLLNLDLLDDWPDITILAFSTKDAQQNQKKRVQCVEWALYQLFALWDPEETRNKLQPFFPPLEPLQSLNLRAALYRCLDHAKKSGVLGRDTALRKTMLDECKGERLEEILAVFSTCVLKKVVAARSDGSRGAIAQQLAFENFSYTGERTALSTLILAHKASLCRTLSEKLEFGARCADFVNLVDLKDRQIARRHEQWKASIEDDGLRNDTTNREARALEEIVQRNWTGSNEWLETIINGSSRGERHGILARPYNEIWKHVEAGSLADLEDQHGKALTEQLDARVREQNQRLEEWQAFEKTLASDRQDGKKAKMREGPSKTTGLGLGFDAHEALQLSAFPVKKSSAETSTLSEDYRRMMEDMQAELAQVGKTRAPAYQIIPQKSVSGRIEDLGGAETTQHIEEYDDGAQDILYAERDSFSSSATTSHKFSPEPEKNVVQFTPPPPLTNPLPEWTDRPAASVDTPPSENEDRPAALGHRAVAEEYLSTPTTRSASAYSVLPPSPNSSSPLASEIVASVMTTSPSPTKLRHVLSLAERTRMSMSRVSRSREDALVEDFEDLDDLPGLVKQAPAGTEQNASYPETEAQQQRHLDRYEDLIARTRQSLSNMASVAKNAQLERRRSVKLAARNKRSSYVPKPLETPLEETEKMLDRLKLIEGEVEPAYEAVFKSRPKIKTSPETSPVRAWGSLGGAFGQGFGSSSPDIGA